jgi:hypothetical protein
VTVEKNDGPFRLQPTSRKPVTKHGRAGIADVHPLWHNPCNPFLSRMHDNTNTQSKHPILVHSRFQERRMAVSTLIWAGFWTGVLLGGISVLMR